MKSQKATQYPLFVYGSLRAGAHNHHIVRDWLEPKGIKPARLEGFQMYNFRYFSGIIQVPVSRPEVVGDILFIKKEHWAECIDWLDFYESNGCLFTRSCNYYARVWNDNIPDEELKTPRLHFVKVWVYIVNDNVMEIIPDRVIKSNDWMNR